MKQEDIEKVQHIFRHLKAENERLTKENEELHRRLGDLLEEQMQQHVADMEVITMVNTPHPVPRRWLFGR